MPRRRRSKKSSRRKLWRYLGGFGLLVAAVVFCLYSVQLPAGSAANNSPLAILSQVPIPELPAKSVEILHAAPAGAKASVVTNIVLAAGGLARPGAMPFIVSALCRENTNLADAIAGTAIGMNGAPVMPIISAAINAAPEMAQKISLAAFAANPEEFQDIALALILRTTNSSTNVLLNLCQALPNFEPFVDTARIQAEQVLEQERYQEATNLAAETSSNYVAQSSANLTDDSTDSTDQASSPMAGVDPENADMANLTAEIATNQDVKQLRYIVYYAEFAITNSGQSIEDVLTNAPATSTAVVLAGDITGTRVELSGVMAGTNVIFTGGLFGTNMTLSSGMAGTNLVLTGGVVGTNVMVTGGITGLSLILTGGIAGTNLVLSGDVTTVATTPTNSLSGTNSALLLNMSTNGLAATNSISGTNAGAALNLSTNLNPNPARP